MGLLDLPAPLWDWFDRGAVALGLPAIVRVAALGALSGWVSMVVYRRLSNQHALAAVARESRALREELARYDGPFDGLRERIGRWMRLSATQLRLSLLPALAAGVPLLLLLPWMSNRFDATLPEPGTLVAVQPQGLRAAPDALQWSGGVAARWDPAAQRWLLPWPRPETPTELRHGTDVLLRLPPAYAVPWIERRVPLWNHLVGNPAGYLPGDAPLDALRLDLPGFAVLPVGPGWLRGWLPSYLVVLVAVSLWLRWRWRLQ